MFDTLLMHCPNCGHETSEQSKAGPCILKEYNLNNAPPEVLADVSTHAYFLCESCDVRLRLNVKVLANVERVG